MKLTMIHENNSINLGLNLGEAYTEHKVFERLKEYIDFYDSVSFLVMGYHTSGTDAMSNIDTYFFTSMKGTLESIKDILLKGRINDSYALLRKFYDSTIINIYTILYLKDNFSTETLFVEQINNWVNGNGSIPRYPKMLEYIKRSERLGDIYILVQKTKKYKNIRARCDDHVHYNFYWNLLLNDNEIHIEDRQKFLNVFLSDLDAIFIQHFAYLFYINDYYMASCDYTDSLDMGLRPEENSQYWVASYVQDIFDKVIKAKRPDIAEAIKSNTLMTLS